MQIDPRVRLARELKGAPLGILFVLEHVEERVTQDWLMRATGYSDKPVRLALAYLEERGLCDRAPGGWALVQAVQAGPAAAMGEKPGPGGSLPGDTLPGEAISPDHDSLEPPAPECDLPPLDEPPLDFALTDPEFDPGEYGVPSDGLAPWEEGETRNFSDSQPPPIRRLDSLVKSVSLSLNHQESDLTDSVLDSDTDPPDRPPQPGENPPGESPPLRLSEVKTPITPEEARRVVVPGLGDTLPAAHMKQVIQILNLAQRLFGRKLYGKPQEYADLPRLLAWVAQAWDRRGEHKGQVRSPVGLVCWAFHRGRDTPPDACYFERPEAYLPGWFVEEAGLPTHDPEADSRRKYVSGEFSDWIEH